MTDIPIHPGGSIADALMERRRTVIAEARAIAEKGVKHGRDLSANEQREFDELVAEADKIHERAKAIKAGENHAQELAETFRAWTGRAPRRTTIGNAEVVESFRSMLLEGNPKPIELSNDGQRSNFQPGVERRALSTTSPANMQAVSFYDRVFEHAVDSAAVLSAGATVINTTTGEDLRVSRSTARSTAGIVVEAATIPESDPTLSSVTLAAFKLAFRVTCSREFIDDSAVDVEGYLARQAGEAIGLGLNNYVLNGDGSGEPTGVIGEATAGVTGPTGTSTSLGDQSTAGEGTDLLVNLAASPPAAYLRSPATAYLLTPAALATVENLKASTGELVGSQFVANSRYPFLVDDDVPAMAADAKSILFGDWSRVVVRIAGGLRFERSDHFAFDSDEVAFRAILRFDSRLVNVDAVRYFANSSS